ncbi:PAS domain S-box protein, partial [bacterium]|nr:PAS domain S-box protein [bacterium]
MSASLFPVAGGLHADSGQADNVLVLHSYHLGNAWCGNINSGIHAAFEESGQYIELYVEYMDTKRQVPEEIFPDLVELFEFKYTDIQFDVIISSDNNAFDFLLEYGADLFPGVPIIFCGVNNYNDAMIEGRSGITGVAEDIDLRATLELALELFPDTNNVAAISDGTESGRINTERMREIAPEFEDSVDFIWLIDRTAEELIAELNSLPDDTLVFYLSFYRDRMGISYTVEESNTLIVGNTDFPVFTSWDISIDYGFLGGIVTSGRLQGKNAAQMAQRILHGESPEDIPVLRDSPNVPMFDYNVMARYGISTGDLPDGSIILNQPVSYYARYRSLILSLTVIIILLVTLITIMGINIAQRIHAVGALKISEEKYHAIFDSALVGMYRSRLSDGKLLEVNDRCIEMLGYPSREDMMKKGFVKDHYYNPEDRELFIELIEKSGEVTQFETQLRRQNGEIIWVRVDARLYREEGYYEGVLIDITDRKQAQEEIRNKNIALEDALKIKNEFLSMVSHELRTPLVPIIGYSDLLLDGSFGELSNEAEDAIDSIKNRADDLVKLIEDLLMVSQIERDKLRVDLQTLDVNKHLRDIISDVQSTDYGKPVEIELSGEEFNVTADPSRFRQVMQNLIGNAIKYSSDIVEIKVETRKDGKNGIISIKDNGIGIAPEHITKIFERFYQAEEIDTRKHSGSGLGLAITRDLVELMDGEITVESEPGEGSNFTVRLPLG